MKKIFKFIRPLLRGTVKSIPFGNVVIETIDEIKQGKADVNKTMEIVVQIAAVTGILYAFFSKQIDINLFIDLLNGIKP